MLKNLLASYCMLIFFTPVLLSQKHGCDSAIVQLSVEVARQYSYYKHAKKSPETSSGYINDDSKNFRFMLGVRVAPRFVIETGIHSEMIWMAWGHQEHFVAEYTFARTMIIPLRACYHLHLFDIFNNPVRLEPSFGFLLGYVGENKVVGAGEQVVSYNLPNYTFVAEHCTRLRNQYYGTSEFRLQLEANISKVISFYGGGGFCLGTKVIGETRGTYSINNGPERTVITQTKGTNYYLNVGIRLRIPNFWK
jgi:hypothetical protein